MYSGIALLFGVLASSLFKGLPKQKMKQWIPLLLGISIVGLGASLNLNEVWRIGAQGFVTTLLSISATLILGLWLGKLLGLPDDLTYLITAGTAICGGSAIAATSQSIKAKEEDVSIALALVFLLNALALFLFPWLGHTLNLSQIQFGLWSAVAIHDTSSVVGANIAYGSVALQLATTVKLARALWIAPVTILIVKIKEYRTPSSEKLKNQPFKIPWFIYGFLLMSAVSTFFNEWQIFFGYLSSAAKILFIFVIFFIGCQINFQSIKKIGKKPFILAVSLWLFISISSLLTVISW